MREGDSLSSQPSKYILLTSQKNNSEPKNLDVKGQKESLWHHSRNQRTPFSCIEEAPSPAAGGDEIYIFCIQKQGPVPNHLFQWATGEIRCFLHITRCEIRIFLSTVYWMTFLSLSPFFVFAFFKYLKVKESKNLVSKIKHLELGLKCTCRKPLSKF